MSSQVNARRASAQITFDGVDITSSITPYLLSLAYTDNEEDETDDLQIKLQDRESLWLQSWLTDAIDAAGSDGFKVNATIIRKNWKSDGQDKKLYCGEFELDSVKASGPPSTVTIKTTSLPYSSQVRQTDKSKEWEAYYLSGIANEIAANNGMTCMYLAPTDPYYSRVEQYETSDIEFLSTLCHEAGISLKVTDNKIVLFEQTDYEGKGTVLTITRGDGSYLKYDLSTGTADTQYDSCRVSYTDPSTGKCIEATAKVEDYDEDAKNNQQLEITARVTSESEAKTKAEKYLRLHNKFAKTASFTMPGHPGLVAGLTLYLSGWGPWSGKYIISQAKHSIGSGGYTTQISVRMVLGGY